MLVRMMFQLLRKLAVAQLRFTEEAAGLMGTATVAGLFTYGWLSVATCMNTMEVVPVGTLCLVCLMQPKMMQS